VYANIIPASYKLTVVRSVAVMIPISAPEPLGYTLDAAILVYMALEVVRLMLELDPLTMICAVSAARDLA
jgi:hypothetical protein